MKNSDLINKAFPLSEIFRFGILCRANDLLFDNSYFHTLTIMQGIFTFNVIFSELAIEAKLASDEKDIKAHRANFNYKISRTESGGYYLFPGDKIAVEDSWEAFNELLRRVLILRHERFNEKALIALNQDDAWLNEFANKNNSRLHGHLSCVYNGMHYKVEDYNKTKKELTLLNGLFFNSKYQPENENNGVTITENRYKYFIRKINRWDLGVQRFYLNSNWNNTIIGCDFSENP